MNTQATTVHKSPQAHPMMIIAAIAIVLFCGVGVAAIMGWLPNSIGGNAAPVSGAIDSALDVHYIHLTTYLIGDVGNLNRSRTRRFDPIATYP